ncbi:YncE family protein [Phycicoccus duodecadis]|uniref:YncE family protein n=1 Tax=Phycicoccus duodecadis TaxID=173053 RepID=UPI000C715517|nr:hypothetical protein [Phycicoccus duodecadis]
MTPSAPGRRAVLLLGSLALAGCSAEGAGGKPPSSPAKKGAEPADAPTPTVAAAGKVAPAGYAAEGMVFDELTASLVVGARRPDRIVVLDPTTLAERRSVRVAGTVRHLGLMPPGGVVLVPNEAGDTVSEVDLRTGAVRSTPVGHVPHDAAGTAAGEVLVADEFSRSMSVVRDGRVVHTFDDLVQPGGVVAAGRLGLVVDVGDYTVSAYDLDRMARVGRVAAGAGPTHAVLAAPTRLAVADTRGGRLRLLSVDPLREVADFAVGPSPYGLAADPGEGLVWVTLSGSNAVVGVSVAGDDPRIVARYPTVRQPNSVAVAPGSRTVFVSSRTDALVQRIAR